jgi:REP element-mobilizing transposase RayT
VVTLREMSRPLRILLPGGLYHVTSRGNRGEPVFVDRGDRAAWLDVLTQVCRRANWRIHAWCQMGNHYHLLVETPEANLPRGMRQLNGVFTQRQNRVRGRSGHVFQGRYHAILVERQTHLLEVARYVVLNPVRAKLVDAAEKWQWSSYASTIGSRPTPAWLETAWTLAQFGSSRSEAISRYIAFVEAGIKAPSPLVNSRGGILSDSDQYSENARRIASESAGGSDLSDIPKAQRREPPPPLHYYESLFADRKEAMARAHATGQFTLKAIGAHFGVHRSTVARVVKLFESGMRPRET